MSKQSENVMLVPGESGWEIWSGTPGTGFTLLSATETSRAADLTGIPAGDVTMLFPVKSITALPLKVATDDTSLFPELAALHAERLGLRPDPMAGQLTDQFVIAKEGENTALLSVVLRSPVEGDLPVRSPKEFDLSARAVPYAGESLALWKEFGRWVFAVSARGQLVYCQATAVGEATLDPGLVREIRLALIQLSLQGLECQPTQVIVYSDGQLDTKALNAFGVPVSVQPKPQPTLPEPHSKLLPADVRAARREAQQRQQTYALVALLLIAYLGGAGWFGYSIWKEKKETTKIQEQAKLVAPEEKMFEEHTAKWNELGPVVDLNQSPVEILLQVVNVIPKNGGIHLKSTEIKGSEKGWEVNLAGEAQQTPPLGQFSGSLTAKGGFFARYKWEIQPPRQTQKGWEFTYIAHEGA